MKFKIKRSVLVILLVLSYSLGNMLFIGYADDADGGIMDLLAQRENQPAKEEITPPETVKKEVDISDFTDVKENDWFYPYLDYLVKRGTVNGKTESTFEPYSTFSYAECSAVIVRYLGLEQEAQKRFTQITDRLPELRNQWYIGYFEVLANLGMFTEYDLFETDNGQIISVDKELANSPVKRYRFAESISKSFELDSELKARNVYPEIGGSGREFIAGGGYNENVLDRYESLISDFEDIPAESRRDVLKAYYNGIFNGDTTGNFYPNNNLTRAEMAKVLTTVCDYSMRTRLIEDGYADVVYEEFLHTDAFGVKTLRFSSSTAVLLREAENLSISGKNVEYVSSNNAPFGYAIDVYLYENGSLCAQCTLHDYNNGGFTYLTDNAKVLFILRNVAQKSRVEGALEVEIVDGDFLEAQPKIRTM